LAGNAASNPITAAEPIMNLRLFAFILNLSLQSEHSVRDKDWYLGYKISGWLLIVKILSNFLSAHLVLMEIMIRLTCGE
jgi:hypothetical protein